MRSSRKTKWRREKSIILPLMIVNSFHFHFDHSTGLRNHLVAVLGVIKTDEKLSFE